MMRICLDTSAYSHFRRGMQEAVQIVTRARSVVVPAIVLGELRVGFRLGTRRVDNEERLRQFIQEPVVAVLNVDDEAAAHYADIVVELRRSGTPLPTNDIWIAALAAREGATVVTADGHFAHIRRVGSLILSTASQSP